MWATCSTAPEERPHDRCGPPRRAAQTRQWHAGGLAARVGVLVFILCAAIVVIPGAAMTAHASGGTPGTAITTLPLTGGADACVANTLAANDDGSTAAVSLGFTLNFFGTQYTSVYVNNNGNITFTGPLSTYTPFGIASAGTKIIAPFFGDVYTIGSTPLTYSSPGATYQGHPAFCVDWVNVGYYQASDKLNSFQAILVDRSDVGVGDFDIIFNYDKVQWETGSASGGTDGLGGSPAHAGYSNGASQSYEFPGSGTIGAFLDSNPSGLIYGSYASTQPGGGDDTARVLNRREPHPPAPSPARRGGARNRCGRCGGLVSRSTRIAHTGWGGWSLVAIRPIRRFRATSCPRWR